jgi:hypothetical protein
MPACSIGHCNLLCRLLDRLFFSDFMLTSIKWSTIKALESQSLCGTLIFPVYLSSLVHYNIQITTKNHFVLFKLLNFREILHQEDTLLYIKCHVFILYCGTVITFCCMVLMIYEFIIQISLYVATNFGLPSFSRLGCSGMSWRKMIHIGRRWSSTQWAKNMVTFRVSWLSWTHHPQWDGGLPSGTLLLQF